MFADEGITEQSTALLREYFRSSIERVYELLLSEPGITTIPSRFTLRDAGSTASHFLETTAVLRPAPSTADDPADPDDPAGASMATSDPLRSRRGSHRVTAATLLPAAA